MWVTWLWNGFVDDQPAEKERVHVGLRVRWLWNRCVDDQNLQAEEVQMVRMRCGSWGSKIGLLAGIMVGFVSSLVSQQTTSLRSKKCMHIYVLAKGRKIRCESWLVFQFGFPADDQPASHEMPVCLQRGYKIQCQGH